MKATIKVANVLKRRIPLPFVLSYCPAGPWEQAIRRQRGQLPAISQAIDIQR
jgi:hypothetical protein